jgi:hypothetical protein
MARHFRRPDGTFWGTVVDGEPTEVGLIEVESAPADGNMVWWGQGWVLPVEIARARRLTALTARYLAALDAGMTYQGKVLQIRENDQINITAVGQEARWALAGGIAWPANFAWRMADNSFLPLPTPQHMIALGEAAKAEVYRLRQVKWGHAAAIAAMETAEAVNAHDIEAGWQLS